MDPTLRLLRLEELVRAMSDVIEQGLALYWGTAGGAPGDVMDTFAVARQLNLAAPVCQWAELPPEPRLFRHLGLGAVTWSPLGPAPTPDEETPGNDTAKARPRPPLARGLQPLAQRLGCSERQLGIAWSLRSEGVSSVLLGAETPRGLRELLQALQVLPRLGPSALRELEPLLGGGAPP
ncbi:voltage-gated potassium channel subunit beta-2-like [Haemorhous mexicanus]|uniref:voltage-gated potassium channel subunit beta-2-like n=1 Tax=Haemorhous mexicanus TaxID=30427 RepID=UPI0028BDF87F|nr:voltage-gated potassium channel subunit beta-2-like [Haemorhous mexicanus]